MRSPASSPSSHEFYPPCGERLRRGGDRLAAQFLLLGRSGAYGRGDAPLRQDHCTASTSSDWAWADANERHGIEYTRTDLRRAVTPITASDSGRKGTSDSRRAEMAKTTRLARLFSNERKCSSSTDAATSTVQFHGGTRATPTLRTSCPGLRTARRKEHPQERRRVRERAASLRGWERERDHAGHWEFFTLCYRATYARTAPVRTSISISSSASAARWRRTWCWCSPTGSEADRRVRADPNAETFTVATGAQSSTCRCCTSSAATTRRSTMRSQNWQYSKWRPRDTRTSSGLLPVETLSAHWLAHPRFARAVEQFLGARGAAIAVT